MVNKTHPDRPGTSGLVIVQTEFELVPDEYFTWEVDGTKNVGLPNDAGMMGSMTTLMGTGFTGNISISYMQTGLIILVWEMSQSRINLV